MSSMPRLCFIMLAKIADDIGYVDLFIYVYKKILMLIICFVWLKCQIFNFINKEIEDHG